MISRKLIHAEVKRKLSCRFALNEILNIQEGIEVKIKQERDLEA